MQSITKQILADLAADRLAEAMELIRNPQNWCRGALGMVDGVRTNPRSEHCTQRCALGSVMAAGNGVDDPAYHLAVDTLERASHRLTPGWGVMDTNDRYLVEKAHQKVMAMFPLAIEILRKEAARRKRQLGIRHPAAEWSAALQTKHPATTT